MDSVRHIVFLRRKNGSVLGRNRRTVGLHQCEVFPTPIELKVSVELSADKGLIRAGCEDHKITTGREVGRRECPRRKVCGPVSQVPASEIHR